MASVFRKSTKHFSIDDAFEDEITVNMYGATGTTNERSPLKPKRKFRNGNDLLNDVENGIPPESSGRECNGNAKQVDGTLSSRGTDSLADDGAGSYKVFDNSQWWCYHPKVRDNWRAVLAAVVLLVVGTGLLALGLYYLYYRDISQTVVFLLTGSICFIPGSYHVVYIYFAVKGKEGFDFYHLPLFN